MVEHVLIFAIKYRVYFLGDQNLYVQDSRRPHPSNTGWRGPHPSNTEWRGTMSQNKNLKIKNLPPKKNLKILNFAVKKYENNEQNSLAHPHSLNARINKAFASPFVARKFDLGNAKHFDHILGVSCVIFISQNSKTQFFSAREALSHVFVGP